MSSETTARRRIQRSKKTNKRKKITNTRLLARSFEERPIAVIISLIEFTEVPSADLPHLPMSCHALLPRPRATRLLICRPRLSESGHRLTWTNLAGQAQIWTNVSDLLSPHHSING